VHVLTHVATDLRYAARIALRRRWVSLAIVLSIAFGSAGTTAIFAVIDRILVRPLPVADSERAVWLRTVDSRDGRVRPGANPGDAFDWRARASSFAALGWYNTGEATMRSSETADPERVRMALASPDLGRALGIQPVLGHLFTSEDYGGSSNSIIVSHRYWRTRLGASRDVVGRTIFQNNVPRTIIGVLSPAGDLLPEADFELWRPMQDNPQQRNQARTASYIVVVGRLADGVSLTGAQAQMDLIARQLAAEHPRTNATRGVKVEPLSDGVVGPARPMFLLLGGAVVTLLLIACASVANLLVAQSEDRAREMAVRIALGGSPGRLVRQLVTESMLLCVIGGALGVLLAPAALRGFVALYPGALPRAAELGIDWRVLAASAAAIVTAGLIAAIPLVRQALRSEAVRGLGAGGRVAGSRRQRRFAGALVVGQLALSIVLLFGGWLLLATYRSISRVDVGFDAEHLLTFDVTPSLARYPSPERIDAFYGALEQRLGELPGVRAVGVSNLIPFVDDNLSEYYGREGRNDQLPNMPLATMQVVSDDFVAAMGLPLLRGRGLAATDEGESPPVVVVNAALAAAHFPGEEVVGKRVTMRGRSWEIIGVVGDKRHATLRQAPIPEMFVSRRHLPRELGGWVTVRTVSDPTAVIPAVRAALRATDPTIALAHVATMSERQAESVAAERFRAVVMAVFAVLALVLATLGLYGVVADGVSRRTREIGIRMALGESAERVRRNVLIGAGVLCLTGLAVGAGGSLAAGRVLGQFLVDRGASDFGVLAGVSVVLAIVTLLAAYVPARRASRVDPIVALRTD
jgi:predicted permease